LPEPTNKFNPIVVGLGEVLWDILPTGPRLGGAPTNFAAHSGVLGANAFVVSAVGNDQLGDDAVAELTNQSVNDGHVARSDKPTGTVKVELSDGQPSYTIATDAAWDFVNWTKELESFASKVNAVSFGSLFQRSAVSQETTRKFLDATRDNCLRVFDVNLRQDFYSDDVITQSLKLADVAKLNEQELPTVAKAVGTTNDKDEFAEALLRKFELKMVMLTLGSEGSFLFTPGQQSFQKAMPVEVVDTVGAGDAFTAAVVMGMLLDQPIAKIHEKASEIAANACRFPGATPNRENPPSEWPTRQ